MSYNALYYVKGIKVQVLYPSRHNIDHFGDALPSHSCKVNSILCLKKRPTFALLYFWYTWTHFDIFWQKYYP